MSDDSMTTNDYSDPDPVNRFLGTLGDKPERQARELQIGIWGTVGSGKTTYLAMLVQDILSRANAGYRIEEDLENPEAMEFLAEQSDLILFDREFPEFTPPDPDNVRTYAFRVYRDVTQNKGVLRRREKPIIQETIVLRFMDAGGEWYRNPEKMMTQHGRQFQERLNPLDSLASCDGIVCLLDTVTALGQSFEAQPSQSKSIDKEFIKDLRGLIRQLKKRRGSERGYLPHAMAFCMNKIDFAWEHRNNPEDLARELLPKKLMNEIMNACHNDRTRWFGTSAVGIVEDSNGNVSSVVKEDLRTIKHEPVDLVPFNLFEPIGWLVSVISGSDSWITK